MIIIHGNDIFENNEFMWSSWSAPVCTTPAELRERLNSFHLRGRTISSIRVLGTVFELDGHGDLEYLLNENDQQSFRRFLEIDEPVILEFIDGEQLEVQFLDGSFVRCSMNCFPKDIHCKRKEDMLDGGRFFSHLIGSRIIDTCITDSQTGFSINTGIYGLQYDFEQDSYIDQFHFLTADPKGTYYSLHLASLYDYGHIWEESYGRHTLITAKEAKDCFLRL